MKYQVVTRNARGSTRTYLPEDKGIPEWMGTDTCGMILVEFCPHSCSEESTLQSRNIAGSHSRLIDSIQYTRYSWEEVRLKHLRIFKETQVIASGKPDASTDGQCCEFNHTLRGGQFRERGE
jgi:hypothetical protein